MDYVAELQSAYTAVVADALDQLGLRDRVLDPGVRALHTSATVAGRALPAQPPTAAPSRILRTRTGSASSRPSSQAMPSSSPSTTALAATWGELFSCAARGRGARAAISDGFIRDARMTARVGFPVSPGGVLRLTLSAAPGSSRSAMTSNVVASL